jgi:5-formyltetrahydrofolate cyclo-ligase
MSGAESAAVRASKRRLRQELKERLCHIDAGERLRAAAQLALQLVPWIEERRRSSAGPVALFASMPEELDTRPLDAALRARAIPRAFPRFDGGALRFFMVGDETALDDLPRGALAIPTPADDVAAEVAARDLAAIVVPGLGFDGRGGRLGRGRAYYDGALRDVDPERAVAIAFDAQLVERVPMEPHDVALGQLWTPARGLLRTAAGGDDQQKNC